MRIDQFTEWDFIHNPQISPKKDKIIFELTKTNLQEDTYQSKLYAFDCQKRKIEFLTELNTSHYFFAGQENKLFIENSKAAGKQKYSQTASTVSKNNTSAYCLFDLTNKESEPAFEIDLNVNDMISLGDEKYILHASKTINPSVNSPERKWLEIGELPFWLNGSLYTLNQLNQIFIFDAKKAKRSRINQKINQRSHLIESIESAEFASSGEKADNKAVEQNTEEQNCLQLISQATENVYFFELAPNKENLIIISAEQSKLLPLKANIFFYHLPSKRRQVISLNEFNVYAVKFIDEQTAYMIATDNQSHGLNSDPCIYKINLNDLSVEKLCDDDFAVGNSIGTDAKFGDGKQIVVFEDELYFICTQREHSVLKKINPTGQVSDVIDFDGSLLSFQILNGDIYYIAMQHLNLPELFVYQEGEHKRLSHYSDSLANTPLAKIEMFQFESNGAILDGFVMKPSNYQVNQKYPALLEIHGGPKTVFGKILHHEMQYLADQGYFVFYTNPHGSDAYGSDFSDIRGKYGSTDYQDLMHFTDLVLKKYPEIDEQRIGCLGGSYGGFMVNWIIGHTQRFAAANSQRSISNWLSFYGVSDIGFYFTKDQTGYDLWQNPQELWRQSPLKYADQVKTPTLFIHSDQDLRCPLEQGIQMYAALMKNQIATKLILFKNETHELSRSGKPQARIKRLAAIRNWFDDYLK